MIFKNFELQYFIEYHLFHIIKDQKLYLHQ